MDWPIGLIIETFTPATVNSVGKDKPLELADKPKQANRTNKYGFNIGFQFMIWKD